MKTLVLLICIHLQIVDLKTKETLPAVTVTTNKAIYYSDFDGNVNIPDGEKIVKVSHIAYNDLTDLNLNTDTIISLKER
jgi:hypothetical protein